MTSIKTCPSSPVSECRAVKPVTLLLCSLVLTGCGSSGGDSGDTVNAGGGSGNGTDVNVNVTTDDSGVSSGNTDDEVVFTELPALSSGEVSLVGTVAVSDETGNVSDIVGSFFSLSSPVSGEDLATRFVGLNSFCEVEPDVISGFDDISVSFIPEIPGTDETISAGDTVVLSEAAGTYVTLSEQGVGDLVFYGTDSTTSLPTGSVPEPLQAFVTGDEFPAFSGIDFPASTTLTGVDFGDSGNVTINTQFSWVAPADAGESGASFIRISSSALGGFFIDNSLRVSCLVRDDGSFSFPAEVQAALGDEYVGGIPTVSRVSVSTAVAGNAALFLVRESFAE